MAATPAWPPKSAPRLFVDTTLSQGLVHVIDGQQAHYLSRVMRVKPGDAVILCDDQTGEWAARVSEAGKRSVTVEAADHLRPRESVPPLTLCAALLKKPRFDLVLEKATELGVARIRPVVTRRCVADALNMDRAHQIITEAAEQCARTALPAIDEPVTLDAMLRDWDGAALFFADESRDAPPAAQVFAKVPPPAAMLIGPEGGFDDAEREAIRAHPAAIPVALGPRILRGETAAIAAMALWMGIAGDWR